ncbi:hypothetical protein [Nocardia wallacei]|uniref:GHMP family kinase ATP-binding protein n=1 Tax=Nocardia wallacei TaxID=480035 RepID=UPI0024590790|nr:hypothetical protein [Nocardia wallacei]
MRADTGARPLTRFPPGTVSNPLGFAVDTAPPAGRISLEYPLRINAMAIDPALVAPTDDHRYSAGEVVLSISETRTVEVIRTGRPRELSIGPDSDRPPVIRHAVGIMRAALGVDDGLEIHAPKLPFLRHSGLGSTSSLIAAVAAAMNELYGRPIGPEHMIRYLAQNHGEESGTDDLLVPVQCLGGSAAAGHVAGSVIVLAGAGVPIATARLDDVDILLATPRAFLDRTADDLLADEVAHMDGFVRTGRKHGPEIAYRLLHHCLPELARDNVRPLGELVFDYRFDMGSIANCAFVLPGLDRLAERLRPLWYAETTLFLGISSVGPTFFAIGQDLEMCRKAFEAEDMVVYRSRPWNGGYRVNSIE